MEMKWLVCHNVLVLYNVSSKANRGVGQSFPDWPRNDGFLSLLVAGLELEFVCNGLHLDFEHKCFQYRDFF